jgi:hypothetical protein
MASARPPHSLPPSFDFHGLQPRPKNLLALADRVRECADLSARRGVWSSYCDFLAESDVSVPILAGAVSSLPPLMLGVGYAAVRAPWPLVFGAALRFMFATAWTPKTPTICTSLASGGIPLGIRAFRSKMRHTRTASLVRPVGRRRSRQHSAPRPAIAPTLCIQDFPPDVTTVRAAVHADVTTPGPDRADRRGALRNDPCARGDGSPGWSRPRRRARPPSAAR